MALLERVSTLIRANLNDLVDKEGHRKVLLDMSDVAFLTSTALGKLVMSRTTAWSEAS